MDISLMVEGQNGLTWDKWSNILRRSEDAGLSGVFRSDHFFIGTQQDSLEPYLSFTMAALQTERIRFGPLVTPVTFRPPVNVGRMAAQLDQLSNGRFVMGLGGGWNESEHLAYGVPFPPVGERLSRLEEAIHVMRGLWGPGPASYEGRFYTLKDADCLPKPPEGRPRLLIDGGGERRTMRFAAQYADEWNCLSMSSEAYTHKVEVLQGHCDAVGRDPSTLKRSMMTFGVVGHNPEAAAEGYRGFMRNVRSTSIDDIMSAARERGMIVGGTEEAIDQLGQLAELGVGEVMFQHMNFSDDEFIAYLGEELVPKAASL